MKGLIVAIGFLTRLPIPRVAVDADGFAASIRWFPAVGFLIGALVAGAGAIGAGIDPWFGALAALCLWVLVTGALHLDGLGDVADACGAAHKDRARMLAVLADPHVGSFGVTAIGLTLLAKLVLLHALIEQAAWIALALVPFAARIGPLIWARWLPDLHAGLGSRFRHAVRPIDQLGWTAGGLGLAGVFPFFLAAPVLILGWGMWLRRKLGGISGDGHGAGIELVEAGLLIAALIVAKLA